MVFERKPLPQISLLIVGAEHPNKRGPDRRFEIAICEPGESIELLPEPANPADPQAIAVYSKRGIQIGYVRADQAQLIGGYLSSGRITGVIFQEATLRGCAIRLAFDGEAPALPAKKAKPPSIEQDFWPDYIPPDD